MSKKYSLAIVLVLGMFLLTGCGVLSFTGQVISSASKVAVTTGKVAIKTLEFAGKAVVATGKVITSVVKLPFGKTVVKLNKKGNTLFVNALLNHKLKTALIIDTGCTTTQLSKQIARKLRINMGRGNEVQCKLADGSIVSAKEVNLKELRVGRARVYNVKAVVLDREMINGQDGLLGMSFLDNFIFKIDAEKGELILERRKK